MNHIKTAKELVKIARELMTASTNKHEFDKEANFYADEPNKWFPKDPHDTQKGQVDVEISGSFDLDDNGNPNEAEIRKAVEDEFKSLEKDLLTPKALTQLQFHFDYDGNEADGFFVIVDAFKSYRYINPGLWNDVLKKHGFKF